MSAVASRVLPLHDHAWLAHLLRLGQETLATHAHHTLLAILVGVRWKIVVTVYVLRLMAVFLNCPNFTIVAWFFELNFASRYLGLHMSLFDLLNSFSGVKRASHVNYFVPFSEISLLVSILVNLGLGNSGWKLLISGIILLFLGKLVDTSVSGVVVRFHLYHLAYFWSVDGLRYFFSFFHVIGLL